MPRRALDGNPAVRLSQAKTTEDLIEIMQDEEEQKKRDEIIKKMPPRLREKYEWIRNWMHKEIKSVLESRYDLGEQVLEIYRDETENGGKVYGKNAIGNICKLLDWDDGVIRACLHFVQAYSREDLSRLSSLVLPRGEPLSWSHIRCLLHVKEPERREALLQQTLHDGLTCVELAYEVKHAADPRGRPVKIPTSFDGLAQQQKQFVDTWEKRYPKVWSNAEQSFSMRAAQLPSEEVNEERLQEAAELAGRLRQMANQAVKAAEKAEEVVQNFTRILAEKSAAEPAKLPSVPVQESGTPPPEAPSLPAPDERKTARKPASGRVTGKPRNSTK